MLASAVVSTDSVDYCRYDKRVNAVNIHIDYTGAAGGETLTANLVRQDGWGSVKSATHTATAGSGYADFAITLDSCYDTFQTPVYRAHSGCNVPTGVGAVDRRLERVVAAIECDGEVGVATAGRCSMCRALDRAPPVLANQVGGQRLAACGARVVDVDVDGIHSLVVATIIDRVGAYNGTSQHGGLGILRPLSSEAYGRASSLLFSRTPL